MIYMIKKIYDDAKKFHYEVYRRSFLFYHSLYKEYIYGFSYPKRYEALKSAVADINTDVAYRCRPKTSVVYKSTYKITRSKE